MNRPLLLLVIGLFFGTGLGLVLGQPQLAHDQADHDHSIGDAAYTALDPALVTDWNGPAPSLDVVLNPDPKGGANLHVMVAGFTFTPAQVNGANAPATGHAHLYVNGENRGRVYGPWLHLPDLEHGPVTVHLSLNANDHRLWVVDGKPLFVEKTFQIE